MLETRHKKLSSLLTTLCIFYALTAPAFAEVIDLENGEFSNRTTPSSQFVTGVLDLDRPPPPNTDDIAVSDDTVPQLVVRSVTPDGPRGALETEALIQTIAAQYRTHPGIHASGLTVGQWQALFRANIAIESNFRQTALSPAGAIGLGQLMPATARTLGVDPHDAEQNLHGSARYLLAQMLRFESVELALAAYNAGPEAVTRYGGIPPYRETQGHVVKVLAIYRSTIGQEST